MNYVFGKLLAHFIMLVTCTCFIERAIQAPSGSLHQYAWVFMALFLMAGVVHEPKQK